MIFRDILYFIFIWIAYGCYDVNIIPYTIIYYLYETFQNTDGDKVSLNDVHHILTVIIGTIAYLCDYKLIIFQQMIVYYNITTCLLLILRDRAHTINNPDDCIVTAILLVITLVSWYRIRIQWSLQLLLDENILILAPYIMMNIYWFIKIIYRAFAISLH